MHTVCSSVPQTNFMLNTVEVVVRFVDVFLFSCCRLVGRTYSNLNTHNVVRRQRRIYVFSVEMAL